jgi:hypothetical protein
MSALPALRRGDRAQQLRLDSCLTELEEAHERDEQIVSPVLASRVGALVPGVVSGMSIAQAIDLVFQAQDSCLQAEPGTALQPAYERNPVLAEAVLGEHLSVRSSKPLDPIEARALTERIRSVANNISLLLLEAQERQAWLALGYRSWERYVRQEFGLSRTRSYELLDHGRLIRAIHALTGALMVEDLPPYAARKVKPHLEQFILELKTRAVGKGVEEIPSLVSEIIQEVRPSPSHARLLERRMGIADLTDRVTDAVATATVGPHRYRVDVEVLLVVVEYLAVMPSAASVARQLVGGETEWTTIERATAWLEDLTAELRAWARPGRDAREGLMEVERPALPKGATA